VISLDILCSKNFSVWASTSYSSYLINDVNLLTVCFHGVLCSVHSLKLYGVMLFNLFLLIQNCAKCKCISVILNVVSGVGRIILLQQLLAVV